jgi:TP901 family phage tail tape measure protein
MATDVQLRLLISAVDRAGRSLQQIGNRLRGIGQAGDDANRRAGAGARRATEAVNGLNRALEKTKDRFTAAGKAGDKMAMVGTRLAAAGAALGAGAFFPIKEAATFERSMARVEAVTTEAEKTFDDLSKKARELGRTTAFTAEEAAGGMRFLGMAGLDTNEVFEAIGPTLNLAAAGELELAEAADIATNVMSAFGKNTSDLTHIMDVLAQTAANSNTDVRQLAEAISYAGPTAKAAGVTFEDLAGRVGLLASNGIKGSRAGTNLRGVIASLVKPTGEAQAALDKLGVTITKNEDGSLNLAKTFADLQAAGFGAEEAFAIFRRTAGGAGVVFAQQSERLQILREKIDNASGAAEKMRETMEDNLVGAFTILKSAISGLLIVLGGPLQEPLEKIALAVAKLTTALANWIEKHPTLAKVIIATTAVVAGLTAAIAAILIPLGLIASGFGAAGAALTAFGGFITATVIPALAGLKVALAGIAATAAPLLPLLAALAGIWGVTKIYQAVNAYREMRDVQKETWEVAKEGIKLGERLQEKWGEFAKVEIDGPLSDKALPELKEFDLELRRSEAYWRGVKAELMGKAQETNFLGRMTADAKAAQAQLAEVDNRIRNNGRIRRRVLDEIQIKEEELAEAVKNAAGEQREAKQKVIEVDKERLEKIKEINLATQQLEIASQKDSLEKIDALRKLELERFERSEEAKTLAEANAVEERQRRIDAINAKYAGQSDAFRTREAEKALSRRQSIMNQEFDLLQARGENEKTELERQYNDGLISLEDYMSSRREILDRETEQQLSNLQAKLDAASQEDRPGIQLEIEGATIDAQARTDALLAEQDRLETALVAKRQSLNDKLAEIESRSLGGPEDVIRKNELELEALDTKHKREIQMLIDYGAEEAQIKDAQAQQDMERAKTVARQDEALYHLRMSAATTAASNISQVMSNVYGEQSKEAKAAFAVQKAISVAQTVMSTYEAAQKAFTAMANIPYVGPVLGGIAAAAAIAGGLARVAQIRAQHLAEGGEVGGVSPHKRADNVPIWATAKEFMQPVDSVNYYGKDFMEALRRRAIPREALVGLQIPKYAAPAVPRRFYASGGSVTPTASKGSGSTPVPTQQEIKIMNYVDQREMLTALGSPEGEDTVINVISRNRDKVQRVLR